MASGTSFNFDDILRLAVDLSDVADEAPDFVRKAVQVTSLKVKNSWRDKLDGARFLEAAKYSISYDTAITGAAITAEIGASLGGQGSLVGIVEYGSPTLAPRGYGAAALQENQDDFVDGITKAMNDAERQAGL